MKLARILRVLLLLFTVAVMVTAVAGPGGPGAQRVLRDACFPPAVVAALMLSAPVRREKREKQAQLTAEKKPPRLTTEEKRREIEGDEFARRLVTGYTTADELRAERNRAWEAARKSAIGSSAEFNRRIREVEDLDARIRALAQANAKRLPVPPAVQLEQLARRYGLPVETPSEQRKRDLRIPYSEAELADLRRKLAESSSRPSIVLPAGAGVSVAQFNAGLRNLLGQPPETFPDGGEFLAGDTPGEEYAPAGQAELSADLLEYITEQVKEAQRNQWPARRREWHVSPEWAQEMREIRNSAGQRVWEPENRGEARGGITGLMYGYPVVVGQEYGTPELAAL